MAIVEGKQGMRIGNMPSIDAVTQDGFIIYSDDGVHTYKMTIAEFAQAIGVVMTGGGDGDGGGGLLYWNEESERIFRDIIEEATYDDRKITWNGAAAIAYEIAAAGRMTWTGVTNENGYTSNFGSQQELYIPDYTDQTGAVWTYPRATKLKYNQIVNAISTIRYPALNDSLAQPNSAYYCGVLNKDAMTPKCYSRLDTKLTFEDIIINPLVKAVHMGSKDGVPGFDEDGLVTLEYDRIYALGQDRVYFGKINLNAVHSQRPFNRKGAMVEGEGWSVYSTYTDHPDGYDTREEAEADLAAMSQAMRNDSWLQVKNPKAGTYEYYFTLYCIGNPKSLGQIQFAKDQNHLEPIIEVGYFPWQLARSYTVMREGNMSHDTSYNGDCYYLNFNLDDEQIYYGYPEMKDGSGGYWGQGLINARYIDTVCYKDQNTGYIFNSPYLNFTPWYDGEQQVPVPEYYDDIYDGVHNGYDPYTRPDGLIYTTYNEALQIPSSIATYWDKADFGGAYFQDDDGTIWYIILTGATRENASPWYKGWPSTREGTSMGDIVTSLPQEFDKYPTALNITMDHWCLDGAEDNSVYDGLDNSNKISFTPHIQEHQYRDPDTQEVTYKYSGYLTQPIVSLKTEYLQNAYHKIQNIGKAVLAELGLKGIRPLWPTDAIGIHSEISATSESALNGGYYRQGNHYEETYNLDAMEGSLYLKGDAYDNGEKVKDKYQRKLIEGEGITIEDDENGNPVISSSGGGGGGSVDVEAAYDSVYKNLDITGFNGKHIRIVNGGGGHFEIADGYDGTTGSEIRLRNVLDFKNNSDSNLTGLVGAILAQIMPVGSSYNADAGKIRLALSSDFTDHTARRINGGKHVYFYGSGANQPGSAASTSGGNDTLFTDCIDTIKKNGVALTKNYDLQTGSYYVDIATGGGSSNPFTIDIGGNYLGSRYVDSNINSFTNLGYIYVQPNDNYCWIQVEVALQSLWSDSEAADSKFILEVRKDGYTGDIVDGNYPSNMSLRSLYFTDVRSVMHDDIVSLWTKLSVSGLVNYTGTDPVKFNVNVKQNTGNRKMVSWRAAVVYVAPPT